MLHFRVADQNWLILLLSRFKDGSSPFIARLLFVDRSEFFFGLFKVVEGSPLVHTVLSNSAVPCHYDVKFAVGVEKNLHFVEDVVSIRTIFQVHFSHIDIPRELFLVIVHLVLFFSFEIFVDWDIIQLFFFLKNFLSALLLCLFKEGMCIIGKVMDEVGPLVFWGDGVASQS